MTVPSNPGPGGVYTHGHHESVLRSHRWRTVENSAAHLIGHLRAGTSVLDVGCGPGTITVDIAQRVAPGRVVGVDPSSDAITAAREAAHAAGVTVDLRVGDLADVVATGETFAIVHAHQVLQHLADPVAALIDMGRACAPGGFIAARDADYASMGWAPADPDLDRWLSLYRQVHRINGGEPDAGRHLLGWAHRAGFTDVQPSASVWCFATPTDRAWWAGTWAERVTATALGTRAVELGLATTDDLAAMAGAWHRWAADDDAWFSVVHAEVLCRT